MDVVAADVIAQQIFGQFFCHAFGKRGHQYTFFFLDTLLYLFHQVVNLIQTGAYFNYRVQQSGRTDNLFNDNAFTFHQFIIGRCSTDINHLLGQFLELFKF